MASSSCSSNIVNGPWVNISAAFDHSVARNSTPIAGYDSTQAFPGRSVIGHNVTLTISQAPEDIVQSSTTVLSSLTFDTPL